MTIANDQIERTRSLELVNRLSALYPAVVSDCLDRLGYRAQVLEPHIRPLYPSAKIAGIAFTVHCVAVDGVPLESDRHYKGELQAVDALQHGDVMVVSTCQSAYWGELLATAARFRGATGVVADAYTRDTLALIEMEFPTFAAGISAYDSLGRIDVDATNVPIECGGVSVDAGDLVLADYDGVVVVPMAIAEEAIAAAEDKVRGENMVRTKLADGMPVWEAFKTYGII